MLSLKHSVTLALALALALTGVITASAATTNAQDQLILNQETDTTAWLGVSIAETEDGVVISSVSSDSPADEAGLQHGDLITAVDDVAIDSADLLIETIQAHAPGDEVAITYTRDDASETVTVTLAERPTVIANVRPARPGQMAGEMFGMLNLFGLNLEVSEDGLLVQSIDEDSPFADAGLEEGDLITAINGKAVTGEFLPPLMLDHMGSDEPTVLTVVRDGEEMEIELNLDMTDLHMEMIPSDSGMGVVPSTTARPTQLGIRFLTINADVVAENDLTVEQGALVTEVYDDTPAAAAGLQADDIILAVDGDLVDEERTLTDRLYAYEEGDVVTLTVLRAGEEISIDVELGPRNVGWMFGASGEGMPFSFGQRMGDRFYIHPFRGQQGFFDMMPDGGFFEMHPFADGGSFGFDFKDHHPFWDQNDDSDSDDNGAGSMDEPDTTEPETEPETTEGTSM